MKGCAYLVEVSSRGQHGSSEPHSVSLAVVGDDFDCNNDNPENGG